jgi:squalene synthase HpnC
MSEQAAQHRSGKGHGDENFPVASHLIHPRHRPAILAFYNFVRTADDIADHATLPPEEKLALLDRLEAALLSGTGEAEAVALHAILQQRGLSPQHAQDLLNAFRLDVTKLRYADWDDLISYCSLSAMPVGRYVLDVHGESRETWQASDALCAALQVINHLQDCGEDCRTLDRVYVPQDALAAAGAAVEDLKAERATPALRACLSALAHKTSGLLEQSRGFAASVADTRLGLEISVIQALAERLTTMLAARDPLSERVHLTKAAMAACAGTGLIRGAVQRFIRPNSTRRDPA